MSRHARSACLVLALLAACLFAGSVAADMEAPNYEQGRSSVTIEGLAVELNVPEGLSADAPAALVVILHGSGGSATGMAGSLHEWGKNGYVVCAPKSKGQVWTNSDLKTVLLIAAHLKRVLPIDPKRVHVVGYSNGGFNLGPLAFNEDLRPCSATWVASGCSPTKVPKWAASHMGALALAGSRDANAASARATVKNLDGKVRTVGVRIQRNLEHEWPGKLMPYLRWWMDTMDGRFEPGVDMNFEWQKSLDVALRRMEGEKKGGLFVYVHDASDKDKAVAKNLQKVVFMDTLVQHYGRQLTPVKLDFAEHKAALETYGIESTPAVLVLKPDGKLKKVLYEKSLKRKKVASAFKSLAPNKKKPGK